MRLRLLRINHYLMLIALIMLQMQALQAYHVYITAPDNDQVLVIDTQTNTQIAAIPVSDEPLDLAATPDGTRVYVTCLLNSKVTYIDTATNTVEGSISVATPPFFIAITPDGSTAYVTGVNLTGPNFIIPIDIATNTAGALIPVPPGYPQAIAIAPDGATAYVTINSGGPSFDYSLYPIAIPAHTVGTPISLGTSPVSNFASSIAIAPDGNTAYVANNDLNSITPVNLNTQTAAASVAVGPGQLGDIAITPDGATAYVTRPSAGTVISLNLATPLVPSLGGSVMVGDSPVGVRVTPDGKTAYTANFQSSDSTPLSLTNPLVPVAEANILLRSSSGDPVIPFYLTILTLPNVSGIIRNNTFLNKTERILIISWTAISDTSNEVVSYRIYRGNVLIGTVLASDPLCFKTCLQGCDCGQSYFVVVVHANGVESNRRPVKI